MNIGAANRQLTNEKSLQQAKDFFKDYYGDDKNHGIPDKGEEERAREALTLLESNGTYDFTKDELTWGCQTAWRNASRCPARMVWHKLRVFDCRHIDTPEQMYEAILEQISDCKSINLSSNKFQYLSPGCLHVSIRLDQNYCGETIWQGFCQLC